MLKKNEEELKNKLDNIEQILKMLVISSVLKEEEIDTIQKNVVEKTSDVLMPLGMKNPRLHFIESKYYLFIEMENIDSLNKIKATYIQASQLITNMKVVLVFDKLHSKRKKSFEDAKISYCISNGEIHIF